MHAIKGRQTEAAPCRSPSCAAWRVLGLTVPAELSAAQVPPELGPVQFGPPCCTSGAVPGHFSALARTLRAARAGAAADVRSQRAAQIGATLPASERTEPAAIGGMDCRKLGLCARRDRRSAHRREDTEAGVCN